MLKNISEMDALECIKTRRSIRKFSNVAVEAEKIGNILDAGRFAPCSGNLQDWKFILVHEEDKKKKLSDICFQQVWMERAPVFIIVCSEWKKNERFYGENGEKFSTQNCAAAVENMLLAAHAQELGACWVSAFLKESVRKLLEIPEEVSPEAIITVGYPAETTPIPKKFTLENLTFLEKWNNRIKDMASYMGTYSEHVSKAVEKGKELVKKAFEK